MFARKKAEPKIVFHADDRGILQVRASVGGKTPVGLVADAVAKSAHLIIYPARPHGPSTIINTFADGRAEVAQNLFGLNYRTAPRTEQVERLKTSFAELCGQDGKPDRNKMIERTGRAFKVVNG